MKYTTQEKALIKSKVKGIRWDAIPESLKQFWINYRNIKN